MPLKFAGDPWEGRYETDVQQFLAFEARGRADKPRERLGPLMRADRGNQDTIWREVLLQGVRYLLHRRSDEDSIENSDIPGKGEAVPK